MSRRGFLNVIGKRDSGFGVLEYDPSDVTANSERAGESGKKLNLNPLDWDLGIANRKIMGDRAISALKEPQKYHDRRIKTEKKLADSLAPYYERMVRELNNAGVPKETAKLVARDRVKKKFEKDSFIIDDLYPESFLPNGLKRLDADAHKAVEGATEDASGPVA